MSCSKCELMLPEELENGRLCLIPPQEQTLHTLEQHLVSQQTTFVRPEHGIVQIDVEAGDVADLAIRLNGILSTPELHDTRALFLPAGHELTLADIGQVQSLYMWINRVQGQWLVRMIREDRTTTYFQPIVSMQNPQSVFAYECLLRGLEADGSIMLPGHMYEVARASGLVHLLDREARIQSIRSAQKKGVDRNLFVNFLPGSVYDPAYCLRTTLTAIQDAGLHPSQVIFEVVESEKTEDVAHLAGILNFYRRSGFRVALDDLGAGYSSLYLLTRLKPDFVKLDMELIRDVDHDTYKSQVVLNLLKMSRNLGVSTVAEGVETREEWDWLAAHGADYLQGYYVGRPDPEPVR